MNHQEIISQKIEFLNGHSQKDLGRDALKIIEQDGELANEIRFIEELWKKPELDTTNKPSAQMQARFYQMLSHAQSAEASASRPVPIAREPLLVRLGLFKPAFQTLLLVVVFSVGWSLNSGNLNKQTAHSVALESKVDALNVMVAMSMLRKDTAAERLAGIDYAKSGNLTDKKLTESLLQLLNSDRSSAVRLSAVGAMAAMEDPNEIKEKIVASLSQQSNVIVQMALVELLQNSSGLTEQQLDLVYSNKELDIEVIGVLNEMYKYENKVI